MYTPIAPLKYFDKWLNLPLAGTWSTEMFLTNASTCWPRSAHINILSWCRDTCGDPFRHFFWELVSQYTNPVFEECCTIYKSWKFGAQWLVLPRIGFFGTLEPCVIISVKLLKFFALDLRQSLFPYEWSWSTVLLLGGLLSATDPVAVVALLKDLGASKKLSTIIEGESLMNDG